MKKLLPYLFVTVAFVLGGLSQSKGQNVVYSTSLSQGQTYCPGSQQYDDWGTFRSNLDTTNNIFLSCKIDGSQMTSPAICNDQSVVMQLAQALNTGTPISLTCNGVTWSVDDNCITGCAVAGDDVEFNAVGGGCACAAGPILRPCIGNANWGGLGPVSCNAPTQTVLAEFEILPPYNNDAGVIGFTNPPVQACAVDSVVVINFRSWGFDTLNSVTLNWSVNGILQPSINWTGVLPQFADTTDTMGTYPLQVGDVIWAWTSSPNGILDSASFNDSAQFIVPPLSLNGTYTIGNSGDYPNFTAAVADLNLVGVCGPVVFNVDPASGPYLEQVSIDEIAGASANNTITFNGGGSVLQYAATVSAERYTLRLNGADWIRFEDLTINALGTSFGWGVHLTAGANNNEFIDNTITTNQISTSTNFVAFVVSGSPTSFSTATEANDNILDGNFLRGGYYGMRWNGTTGGLGVTNNIIRNNEIADFRLYGVYLDDTDGTIVAQNDINRANRVSVSTFYGVFLTAGNRNVLVDGNEVHNSHGSASSLFGTSYPIYLSGCDAPFGEENIVQNNLIYDINSNGTIYGIYNFSSDGSYYYNNTISLDHVAATGGTTRGIFSTSTLFNVHYKNNIISITRGGSGTKHGFYNSATASFYELDHNNIYVNSAGTGQQNYGFFSGNQVDLAAWQAATAASGYGQNDTDLMPGFVDLLNFDFHLAGYNNPIQNLGDTLDAGIATLDKDSAIRNMTSPDPGAYEYISVAEITNILSPMTGCYLTANEVVSIDLANNSTDTAGNFDVGYIVTDPNGASTTVIEQVTQILAPGGTMTYNFNATADFSMTGVYTLEAFVLNRPSLINTITKYALPVIDLGPDTTICIGSTITLDAENPGSTYSWSTGAVSQTVDITTTQLVDVVVTTTDGCIDSSEVNIVVSDPQIDLGPDTALCVNDVLVRDVTIPGSSYTWSTGSNLPIEVLSPGSTHWATLTDTAGCFTSDTINITVLPAPTASFTTTVTPVWNFQFNNTSTGAGTYFWDFGDGNTSTAASPSHTYSTRPDPVVVTLTVTNACGSATYSNTLFDVGVGVDDPAQLEAAFEAYPNPNNGQFTVNLLGVQAEKLSLEMTNVFGQMIENREYSDVNGQFTDQFDLQNVASGIYFLKVDVDGHSITKEIVVK